MPCHDRSVHKLQIPCITLNAFWTVIRKINALIPKVDQQHNDLLFRKRHSEVLNQFLFTYSPNNALGI